MKRILIAVLLVSGIAGAVVAAEPPDPVHFQGVMRDGQDNPLDGDFDVILRLFDAEVGGNEILIDTHAASGTGAVTFTGGLFSMHLGGGDVTDGTGPSYFDSLRDVFTNYGNGTVWMEVEVGGEVLAPRIQVLSAPYSVNAGTLAGLPADYFLDTTVTEQTKTGTLGMDSTGNYGLDARGLACGGYFEDANQSGHAYFALGNTGVEGYGTWMGGRFADHDDSGIANLGYGNYGVRGFGDAAGGYFQDIDGSDPPPGISWALLGAEWSGGHYGVVAHGASRGALFRRTDEEGTGFALFGQSALGMWTMGTSEGGLFFCVPDCSGQATLSADQRGIWGRGLFAGATFSHLDNVTYWADVAQEVGDPPTIYKIRGTGIVSFVQNHPEDPDRVIVYSAPEGDETAVYTRGTGRLVKGEARVPLGDTFRWVANPDLGLTAHVTPRGEGSRLYVESVTPWELVVRAHADGAEDTVFDYMVFGLRIGFEHSNVVQAKDREALVPASGVGDEFYSQELRPDSHAALDRFRRMAAETRGVAPESVTLSGATRLREAIRASGWQELGRAATERRPGEAAEEPKESFANPIPAEHAVLVPVSEAVDVGDLLVLDPEHPGRLRRADSAEDPSVVGIVADKLVTIDGQLHAPLVDSLFASVKVDANYGVVLPGDLLTSSPTAGHAMRVSVPAPETVVAKALEPLESGQGTIKVLVMP